MQLFFATLNGNEIVFFVFAGSANGRVVNIRRACIAAAIAYVNGALSVIKAPLTITANNAAKTFNTPNPALTWTASVFVNGEGTSVLTPSPTCTTTAVTMGPAGSYPITCSGANATNYAISYVSGTLAVSCRYVSITLYLPA